VALSGGHTPRQTYELLDQAPLQDQVAWEQVHIFWGEERCVTPDDPRSNMVYNENNGVDLRAVFSSTPTAFSRQWKCWPRRGTATWRR
jgi:6-phosphogluconolactonase/glucosamine-6-phosphate isomerase/deaminase